VTPIRDALRNVRLMQSAQPIVLALDSDAATLVLEPVESMQSVAWINRRTKPFVPVQRDTLDIRLNLADHKLQLTFVRLEFAERMLDVSLASTTQERRDQFAAACLDMSEMPS